MEICLAKEANQCFDSCCILLISERSNRKVTIFQVNIRLDVFKMSSRHKTDVLQKCLQDIFKTSCQDVFKTSSKRLQDVLQKRLQDILKTSSRRRHKIFKTFCKDVFKTFSKGITKLNCFC